MPSRQCKLVKQHLRGSGPVGDLATATAAVAKKKAVDTVSTLDALVAAAAAAFDKMCDKVADPAAATAASDAAGAAVAAVPVPLLHAPSAEEVPAPVPVLDVAAAAAVAAATAAARIQDLEEQVVTMAQQLAAGQQRETDMQRANDEVLQLKWATEQRLQQEIADLRREAEREAEEHMSAVAHLMQEVDASKQHADMTATHYQTVVDQLQQRVTQLEQQVTQLEQLRAEAIASATTATTAAESLLERVQRTDAALVVLQQRTMAAEEAAANAATAEQRAAAAELHMQQVVTDCQGWKTYSDGLHSNLTKCRDEVQRLSVELDKAKAALEAANAKVAHVRNEAKKHTDHMNSEMSSFKQASVYAAAQAATRIKSLEADLARAGADHSAATEASLRALKAQVSELSSRNRHLEEEGRAHLLAVKKAQAVAEESRTAKAAALDKAEEMKRQARGAERMGREAGREAGRTEGRHTALEAVLASIHQAVAGTADQALFERTPLPALLTKLRAGSSSGAVVKKE